MLDEDRHFPASYISRVRSILTQYWYSKDLRFPDSLHQNTWPILKIRCTINTDLYPRTEKSNTNVLRKKITFGRSFRNAAQPKLPATDSKTSSQRHHNTFVLNELKWDFQLHKPSHTAEVRTMFSEYWCLFSLSSESIWHGGGLMVVASNWYTYPALDFRISKSNTFGMAARNQQRVTPTMDVNLFKDGSLLRAIHRLDNLDKISERKFQYRVPSPHLSSRAS